MVIVPNAMPVAIALGKRVSNLAGSRSVAMSISFGYIPNAASLTAPPTNHAPPLAKEILLRTEVNSCGN